MAEMTDRKRLMGDYMAAWNARDADRVAAFFSDDAVYADHGAGETAHGRAAIRSHVAAVHRGFPDLEFELVRAAHGENFTAGEWRSRMTHGGEFAGLVPTGRVVESSGVDVATVDSDGLIVNLDYYYDGAAIMRALRLLPARGSRTERALVRIASAATRLGRR
jgi:steroid delta-isomerase-like uncharacterized protein